MNDPSRNLYSSRTFIPTHYFVRTLLPNVLYSQRQISQMYQFAIITSSGLVSYKITGTICNGINYPYLPSNRNRIDNPSIFSKSNLLELFSQATFPQCYIICIQKLKIWVSSDGLDFFLSTNRNYFRRNQLSAFEFGRDKRIIHAVLIRGEMQV